MIKKIYFQVFDQQWTANGVLIRKHKFWKGSVRQTAYGWTDEKKTSF